MDTPGAYRLVDRAPCVVSGGTDEGDEASMPSPEALSGTTDRPKKGSGGSTGIGNFGRFKAQKVKSLVTRSTHLKRESFNRASINRSDESTFYDADEDESFFERRKDVSDLD
ncbi:DEAD-box ATP-dependent RNA helicase 50-like [Phragmites australis]|uniref:DEAD-box ATP-dependent RNA helicase 50-like n=1 Tax=Phragmites australis TaxID=29695 RepID=UPI002D77FDD8|nr:DEAD-box ATP-dependent RNA helicase 50-like [Phragmites australis]